LQRIIPAFEVKSIKAHFKILIFRLI